MADYTVEDLYADEGFQELPDDQQEAVEAELFRSEPEPVEQQEYSYTSEDLESDEGFQELPSDQQEAVRAELFKTEPVELEPDSEEYWLNEYEKEHPYEQDNAAVRGGKIAWNGTATSFNVARGDFEEAAELIAEGAEYAARNKGSIEEQELGQRFEKGEGFWGGVGGVVDELITDVEDAEGVGGKLHAGYRNTKAMLAGLASQAGNSVAPLVLGAGGALAGSTLPGAGTAIGAIGGSIAGNTIAVSGEIVRDQLQRAGINPLDKKAVAAFLEENQADLLKKMGMKGFILGIVDAFTFKAGGAVLRAPFKKAASKVLKSKGITGKAEISKALKDKAIINEIKQDAEYIAASQGLRNAGRNAVAASMEPLGEGGGELGGNYAVTGELDFKAAGAEAVMSTGQSSVTFGVQKALQVVKRGVPGSRQVKQAQAELEVEAVKLDTEAEVLEQRDEDGFLNVDRVLKADEKRHDARILRGEEDISETGRITPEELDSIDAQMEPASAEQPDGVLARHLGTPSREDTGPVNELEGEGNSVQSVLDEWTPSMASEEVIDVEANMAGQESSTTTRHEGKQPRKDTGPIYNLEGEGNSVQDVLDEAAGTKAEEETKTEEVKSFGFKFTSQQKASLEKTFESTGSTSVVGGDLGFTAPEVESMQAGGLLDENGVMTRENFGKATAPAAEAAPEAVAAAEDTAPVEDVVIETYGNNSRVVVKGDPQEIKTKLRKAGLKFGGRTNPKLGGVTFSEAQAVQVRAILETSKTSSKDQKTSQGLDDETTSTQATDEDAAVQALNEQFKQQGIEGVSVSKSTLSDNAASQDQGGKSTSRGTTKSEGKLAEKIASVFGKKIAWVKIGKTLAFNGLIVPNHATLNGTIFVDSRTKTAAHTVAGHELSHFMETESPEVYQTLLDALEPQIKGHDAYALSHSYGAEFTRADVTREIVGDLMGDAFADPKFWSQVAKKNPGTFKQIADSIIGWIDNLIKQVAGGKGLGSEKYVSDLKATRAAIVDATAAYATTKGSTGKGSSDAKFSTVESIQKAMPGVTVKQAGKNFSVTTPAGHMITVTPVGEIKTKAGESAAGSWQATIIGREGTIQLAKSSDTGTLKHEVYHAAESMVLTPAEVAQVRARYGDSEARAEAYRRWDGKASNKPFAKIKAYFKSLANAFGFTFDMTQEQADAIFNRLYSGKAWKRKFDRFGAGALNIGDIGTEIHYALDKLKWEADVQQDVFGSVNNRLGKELKLFERLFGPSSKAIMAPGILVKGKRPLARTIKAHDMGMEVQRVIKSGEYGAFMSDKRTDQEMADAYTDVSKVERSFILGDIKVMRGRDEILSDNGKAGRGVDFGLSTCQPTENCQVCYAAKGLVRNSHVRKSMRNTFHVMSDPTGFAEQVAKEAKKIPINRLPFLRLLGSGDLTSSEQVESFNHLAKKLDRPIQIFSRHHDNLAKLKSTQNAPFTKMGSVDNALIKEYGIEKLSNNMKDHGIANAVLFMDESEIPNIEKLADNKAIGLVLSAKEELHDKLPVDIQKMSCPCDAMERTYHGSCRQCALSQAGCFVTFADIAIAKDGSIVRMGDKGSETAFPVINMASNPDFTQDKSYLEAFNYIIDSSAKVVKDHVRALNSFKTGGKGAKRKSILLRDLRFPGSVVMLIDEGNPYGVKPNKNYTVIESPDPAADARAYLEELTNLKEKAKAGTFYLPGGEIQPALAWRDWQRLSDPGAMSEAAKGEIGGTSTLGGSGKVKFSKVETKLAKAENIRFSTVTKGKEYAVWSHGHPALTGQEISEAEGNKGYVFKVFHGTTHDFNVFDPTITGDKAGAFGAVNYFTSDRGDADQNYAGEGPDLTNRIDELGERLEEVYDVDETAAELGIDPEEVEAAQGNSEAARQLASEHLSGGQPNRMDVLVRLDNPAFVNGDTTTWIENDVTEQYRVDAIQEMKDVEDATVEQIADGEFDDQIQEFMDESAMYDELPVQAAINKAVNEAWSPDFGTSDALFDPGIDANTLYRELLAVFSGSEDPETGNLIGHHLTGQVFKHLGFDGIVLQNADKKFPGMAMGVETSHVHVFEETPSQIKSADKNSGAYSEANSDIRYSKAPVSNPANNKSELTQKMGKRRVGNMVKSGLLSFVSQSEAAKFLKTFGAKFSVDGSISLFHGSGKDNLVKFEEKYVGSGVGQNLDGWGLYLTDALSDAKGFQEMISRKYWVDGATYGVGTSVGEDAYLDWSKDYKDQSTHVRKAIDAIRVETKPKKKLFKKISRNDELLESSLNHPRASGDTIYRSLRDHKFLGDQKATSKYLLSHGIQGNKTIGKKEGKEVTTNHYIDFDPASLSIEVKYSKDGKVQGFTLPSGKVYLVDKNIKKGKVFGVLLHELGGHNFIENAFKGKKWDAITKTFKRREGRDTATGRAIRAARARIPEGTPEGDVNSELVAYFLEDSANKELSLYRKIMAHIKKVLTDMGVPAGVLSPDDMLVIARAAVDRMARNAPAGKSKSAGTSDKPASLTKSVAAVRFSTVEEKAGAYSGIAPKWYSRLQETISTKGPNKAPAKQWLATLAQWKKKGTLPAAVQEELEWSGLEEYLQGAEGKVSRADVLSYLKENSVSVEEVVKGKDDPLLLPEISEADSIDKLALSLENENMTEWLTEDFQDRFDVKEYNEMSTRDIAEVIMEATEWGDIDQGFSEYQQEVINEAVGISQDLREEVAEQELTGDYDSGKFADYQLPGGENYQEMLLTLPIKSKQVVYTEDNVIFVTEKEELSANLPKIFWYFKTPDNVLQIPKSQHKTKAEAKEYVIREKQPESYFPDDYTSPHFDEKNILAHIRFNDRVDADGNKVLFVEEVQSDWMQEGRNKGFDRNKEDRIAELREKSNSGTATLEDQQEYNELRRREKAGVPDAPFKTTHSMLAMKRVIRYAAENGYDKVAWISGGQTKARYDLSKKIAEVHYSGTNLKAYDHDGATVLNRTGVKESEIVDYIGREPSERLLAQPKQGTLRSITGEDLAVGGKWANSLYDKALPKQVGRFIKKYGSKVGVVDLGKGIKDDEVGQQLGFPVTDKMKAKALGSGMPMFSTVEERRNQTTLNAEMDGEKSESSPGEGTRIIREIMNVSRRVARTKAEQAKLTFEKERKYVEAYQALAAAAKDPHASIATKQKMLANFARVLPKEIQGKVLIPESLISRFKTTKTHMKRLDEALAKSEKALTRYLRSSLRAGIKKGVKAKKLPKNKVAKSNLGHEAARDIDYIRTVLKEKDLATLAASLDGQIAELEDSEDAILQERLDNLKSHRNIVETFGDLRGQSLDELLFAREALESIITDGRALWRAQQDAFREKIAPLVEGVQQDISGQEEPDIETAAEASRREAERRTAWGRIKQAGHAVENGVLSWEFLLNKLAIKSGMKTLKSFTVKKLGSVAQAATTTENEFNLESNETITSNADRIYGKTGRKLNKQMADEAKPEADKVFAYDENGKQIESFVISKQQAAYVYAIRKNPDSLPTFEAMRMTDKTFQEIEAFIGEDLKSWVDYAVDDFLQDFYHPINDVYRTINGVNLTNTPGYISWHREVAGKAQEKGFSSNSYEAGAGGLTKGALKQRVKNTNHFRMMGFNEVLMNHVAEMNNYRAWAEPSKVINGVFNNHDTQKLIMQHHGPDMRNAVKSFQHDFVKSPSELRGDLPWLDRIRGNITTAMTALNPTIFLKQLTSIPAMAESIPASEWAKYSLAFWGNPVKAWNILKQSTHWEARRKVGMERDIRTAQAVSGSQAVAGVRSIKNRAMFMVKGGDSAAILVGGYPVYRYHFEKNKGTMGSEAAHEYALKKFETAMDRTQQSGAVKDQGRFQRGGSYAKLFTMFITAPKQYSSQIIAATRQIQQNPKDSDGYKRLFIFAVLMPSLFQATASGLLGLVGGDDEDREDFVKDQIKAILQSPLNGLPIIRDLQAGAWESAMGGWRGSTIQYSPATEVGTSLMNAIVYGGKIFREDTREDKRTAAGKAVNEVLDTIGYATGLPAKTVRKMITENWADVYKGETDAPIRRAMGFSRAAMNERGSRFSRNKKAMAAADKRRKAKTPEEGDRQLIRAKRVTKPIVTKMNRLKKRIKKMQDRGSSVDFLEKRLEAEVKKYNNAFERIVG